MTEKDGIHLGHLAPHGTEPAAIDLREREQFPFDCITEMTVKFETPAARRAREQQEARNSLHEHRMDFIRLTLASVLLVGFFFLSVYLLALKPDATEKEQLLALAGTIVGGGGVYAFRNKPNKSG